MLTFKKKSHFVSTVINLFKYEKHDNVSLKDIPGYQPTVACVSQHLVVMINAMQSHQNKTMTAKEVDVLLDKVKPWVHERLINMTQKGSGNAAEELYVPLITYLETKALWH